MEDDIKNMKRIIKSLEKLVEKHFPNTIPTEIAAVYVSIMALAEATLQVTPEAFIESYNRVFNTMIEQPYTEVIDYKTFKGGSLN